MSRLSSLLKKAVELLEEQWVSFSRLDGWIRHEKSVPGEVREEWMRICQLQDFFRREQLQKIVQAASSWEESRDESRACHFVLDTLRFLGQGAASLEDLIEHWIGAIGAERGMLLACSEESSQARVLGAANLSDPNLTLEEFEISRTVFRNVLHSGQGVLIRDVNEDRAYAGQTSILRGKIRSVLAAPVRSGKRTLGILYLDGTKAEQAFCETDLECLTNITPLVKVLYFSAAGTPGQSEGVGEVFLEDDRALHGLIGRSPEFLASLALLKKVAPTPAPVLLTGESGTGKELFARALHALSSRKSGPFVPINCAAIPDTLLESELFGHEKGAFSGADSLRIGKFERAARGTLFLDEIGELKLDLQAKILRFLESGEIDRIGGGVPFRVDARVVAATNQDLPNKVAAGGFRPDLYFRLNVFAIQLPPLRARKEDIRTLAEHFYRKYAALLDLGSLDVSPGIYRALENYGYPGNVRELENIVYRSLLLSDKGRVTLECLPDGMRVTGVRDLAKNPFWHLVKTVPEDYADLADRKEQMKQICRTEVSYLERRFAEAMVERAGGNITRAAELAGVDRGQFHRLLKPGDPD